MKRHKKSDTIQINRMGREPPQYSAKKRDGIARHSITRQNNTRNSTVQHNVERHNSTCDGSSVQYGMITVRPHFVGTCNDKRRQCGQMIKALAQLVTWWSRFKPSILLLARFVLAYPVFNSLTALSQPTGLSPQCQLGFFLTLCVETVFNFYNLEAGPQFYLSVTVQCYQP